VLLYFYDLIFKDSKLSSTILHLILLNDGYNFNPTLISDCNHIEIFTILFFYMLKEH